MRAQSTIRFGLALGAALLALGAAGCAGCENSVCCSLPSHALPSVLRPSQCTAMGGTSVAVAMCETICCEASDGTLSPQPRMSCTHVVEPRLCDVPDGG